MFSGATAVDDDGGQATELIRQVVRNNVEDVGLRVA